jgi:integrase/recombinase XerD
LQVDQAISYFLSAKEAEGRTPMTISSYSRALYRLAKWLPDDAEVERLDKWQLREFIGFLRKDGLRDVSVATYIRHINAFLAWLTKEEIRPRLKVEVPKFDQPELPILDREDFWKLMAACDTTTDKGRRDAAILLFLLDTGVRVGELVTLTRDNVDLKARTARVIGKARRYRTVFFGVETALAMNRYDKRRPRGYTPTYFFCGHRDKPLTIYGVRQILERLGKLAGVKGPVNPHAFRHTMATAYLRGGGDPATLQRILGHTDISTTIRNYSHLVTDDLKAAHEKFSPLVGAMSRKR